MWLIKRIEEADYGCEERMPGEPLMVLVTIENEIGECTRFEVAENWLELQALNEGDEWPEDIECIDADEENANAQMKWMDGYLQAVSDMEEQR